MDTNRNTDRALPCPFAEEEKLPVQQVLSYSCLPQPKRAKDEDVPLSSSYHVTGLRAVALLVVLIGVTLSMVTSFVFLFSGADVRLQLPVFPFLSPFSLLGLIGVGGGVGIVLRRKLISIIKHNPKKQRTQRNVSIVTIATGGRIILPPKPADRQVGDLSSSWRDRWSPEWESELQRWAEKREALHMRQRLHALRFHAADGFPYDESQKKHSHIKMTADFFLSESRQPLSQQKRQHIP